MVQPSMIVFALGAYDGEMGSVLNIGLWMAVAATLGLGGLMAARAAKRYLQRDQRPEAFTLQDLRDLRAEEKISEEEFNTLRTTLLGRLESEMVGPAGGESAQAETGSADGGDDG